MVYYCAVLCLKKFPTFINNNAVVYPMENTVCVHASTKLFVLSLPVTTACRNA